MYDNILLRKITVRNKIFHLLFTSTKHICIFLYTCICKLFRTSNRDAINECCSHLFQVTWWNNACKVWALSM